MQELNIDSPRQAIRKVLVGENVKIFNFVNAYECSIGSNTKIGAFVEIQKGAVIGENCKISSHTFICEGIKIGNGVFVGHSVTFINDRSPRAVNADGSQKTDADWTLEDTIIEDGVGIGSGSTIMCGIKIGKNAIIGAGSVVTKNVEPGTVVAGNPAKYIRDIREGE